MAADYVYCASEKLLERMKAAGVKSGSELARKMGMGEKAGRNLTNGKPVTRCLRSTLQKAARVLKCKPDDLMAE